MASQVANLEYVSSNSRSRFQDIHIKSVNENSSTMTNGNADLESLLRTLSNSSNGSGRLDALDRLSSVIRRYDGRLPLRDPLTLFQALSLSLLDQEWEMRHRSINLVLEMIPRYHGDIDSFMSVVQHLVPLLADKKITIRRAATQCIHTYMKYALNFETVLTELVRCGLQHPNVDVQRECCVALPLLLTSDFAKENYSTLVLELAKKLVSPVETMSNVALKALECIRILVGNTVFETYLQSLPNSMSKYYRRISNQTTATSLGTSTSTSDSSSSAAIISPPVQSTPQQKVMILKSTTPEFSESANNATRLAFGIVPRSIMTQLDDSEDFRLRALAVEELLTCVSSLDTLEALRPHLQAFFTFLHSLLDDSNFKITTVTLEILVGLVNRLGVNAKPYLRQITSAMTKRLGDNKIVVRQGVMKLAILLMQILNPQQVLDYICENLNNRNSRVRQEAINIIIGSLLTFPRVDFELSRLCNAVAPSLIDSKRQVRHAALDCMSVLAQSLGAGKLEPLVQAVHGVERAVGGDGVLKAVQARLSRRQLPRLNQDGLVDYATSVPSSAATRHSYSLSDSSLGSSGVTLGADSEWILAASSSAGSARSRPAELIDIELEGQSLSTERRKMSAGKSGKNKLPWTESKTSTSVNEQINAIENSLSQPPFSKATHVSTPRLSAGAQPNAEFSYAVAMGGKVHRLTDIPVEVRKQPARLANKIRSESLASYTPISLDVSPNFAESTEGHENEATAMALQRQNNNFKSEGNKAPLPLKPQMVRSSDKKGGQMLVPPITKNDGLNDVDSPFRSKATSRVNPHGIDGHEEMASDYEMANSLLSIRTSASKKKALKVFVDAERKSKMGSGSDDDESLSSLSRRSTQISSANSSNQSEITANARTKFNPYTGATFKENPFYDGKVIGRGYSDETFEVPHNGAKSLTSYESSPNLGLGTSSGVSFNNRRASNSNAEVPIPKPRALARRQPVKTFENEDNKINLTNTTAKGSMTTSQSSTKTTFDTDTKLVGRSTPESEDISSNHKRSPQLRENGANRLLTKTTNVVTVKMANRSQLALENTLPNRKNPLLVEKSINKAPRHSPPTMEGSKKTLLTSTKDVVTNLASHQSPPALETTPPNRKIPSSLEENTNKSVLTNSNSSTTNLASLNPAAFEITLPEEKKLNSLLINGHSKNDALKSTATAAMPIKAKKVTSRQSRHDKLPVVIMSKAPTTSSSASFFSILPELPRWEEVRGEPLQENYKHEAAPEKVDAVGKGIFDASFVRHNDNDALMGNFGAESISRRNSRSIDTKLNDGIVAVGFASSGLDDEEDESPPVVLNMSRGLQERLVNKRQQQVEQQLRKLQQEHAIEERQKEALEREKSQPSNELENITKNFSKPPTIPSSTSGSSKKPRVPLQQQQQSSSPQAASRGSSSGPLKLNIDAESGPINNPDKAIGEALAAMQDEDWERKCEGLFLVRRLAEHHPESLSRDLHTVVLNVSREMKNLRSMVARTAIQCQAHLFRTMRRLMDPDLDHVAKILLSKAGESNDFIRDDVNAALSEMVEHLNPQRVCATLVAGGAQHKNTLVRRVTAQYLCDLCIKMGPGKVLSGIKDVTDKVLPAVAQFTSDGNPETRYFGRKMINNLMGHEDFERTCKKYLAANSWRNVQDVISHLKSKGLGEMPSAAPSAGIRRSDSLSRTTSANSLVETGTTSTTDSNRRKSSNGSKINSMDSQEAVEKRDNLIKQLTDKDWRIRQEGINEMIDLVEINTDFIGAHIVKIFDAFAPRLKDANNKVAIQALSAFHTLVPLLHIHLHKVVNLIIQSVANNTNLSSQNPDIRRATTDLIGAFINHMEPGVLLLPFVQACAQINKNNKSELIDIIAQLCEKLLNQHKLRIVTLHVEPELWRLLNSLANGVTGSTGVNCQPAVGRLVRLLYFHNGEDLVEHARQASNSPQVLQLLQEMIDDTT